MNIGLCGTGRMGAAIAHRLLSVGHTVTVWNRDKAKTKPLAEAGAAVASTPAALAAACDLTITMLLDDAALDAVYSGPDGVLSADLGGKAVMDMSTVLPETEERIGAATQARGAAFVECPVGGTVGPARDGKLFGLVGGEDADVARLRPVLDQLCRRVEHVGPVGSGARLKLAINLPLLVYWQSLGEALALCKPLNLPPERLVDIMADTSGTTNGMKLRAPDIAKALAGQPLGAPAFDVRAARKDLATMVAYARTLGLELPTAQGALGSFTEAAQSGLEGQDAISVPVRWAGKTGARS
ncbi:NAD(P)-dependent oxidoreductase [Alsobacter sp. KACC 23698]|uniref:NAD(P)-dependent oxidoreductase n=1 Tax=Alsobacter sp. KACC 23698 TaxID=3149229 RepID=A0AAU7JAL8_9HYPH